MNDLACRASAPDPTWLARQLLRLNDDAIVIAHLEHEENPAMDRKAAASDLHRCGNDVVTCLSPKLTIGPMQRQSQTQ